MAAFDPDAFLAGTIQSSTPTYGPTQPNAMGHVQPWANRPPKEQLDWQQRAYNEGQKRLDDMRSIVSQGQDVMSQLDAFGEYNKSSRTGANYEGGWTSAFVPESWRGQDEKNMQAITADLAPKKRVAGSGTTSDKDIALYLRSLPSIEQPGQVNKAIRLNYQNQLDNSQAKYSFFQDWLNKNGNLNDADAYWARHRKELGWKPVPTITEIQSKMTKGQKQGAILQTNVPEGITSAEWAAMSPEQKALWSK